jgi:threonine synthase
MERLAADGKYIFDAPTLDFSGAFATEKECFEGIKAMYQASGYIMDPHTAVAYMAYKKYRRRSGDETPNIILSTASAFKFPDSVCAAINPMYAGRPALDLLDTLQAFNHGFIPEQIAGLRDKKIRHTMVCMPNEMRQMVLNALEKVNPA